MSINTPILLINSVTINGEDILKHKRNRGIDVVKKLLWIVSVKGRLEAMQKTLKVFFVHKYVCVHSYNCSGVLNAYDGRREGRRPIYEYVCTPPSKKLRKVPHNSTVCEGLNISSSFFP